MPIVIEQPAPAGFTSVYAQAGQLQGRFQALENAYRSNALAAEMADREAQRRHEGSLAWGRLAQDAMNQEMQLEAQRNMQAQQLASAYVLEGMRQIGDIARVREQAAMAAWVHEREVTQVEQMRLRQRQNAISEILSDHTLDDDEKADMIRLLKTGIDSVEMRLKRDQQRRLQAAMAEEAKKAEWAADLQRRQRSGDFSWWQATNNEAAHRGLQAIPVQLPDGTLSSVIVDPEGKFHTVKPERPMRHELTPSEAFRIFESVRESVDKKAAERDYLGNPVSPGLATPEGRREAIISELQAALAASGADGNEIQRIMKAMGATLPAGQPGPTQPGPTQPGQAQPAAPGRPTPQDVTRAAMSTLQMEESNLIQRPDLPVDVKNQAIGVIRQLRDIYRQHGATGLPPEVQGRVNQLVDQYSQLARPSAPADPMVNASQRLAQLAQQLPVSQSFKQQLVDLASQTREAASDPNKRASIPALASSTREMLSLVQLPPEVQDEMNQIIQQMIQGSQTQPAR